MFRVTGLAPLDSKYATIRSWPLHEAPKLGKGEGERRGLDRREGGRGRREEKDGGREDMWLMWRGRMGLGRKGTKWQGRREKGEGEGRKEKGGGRKEEGEQTVQSGGLMKVTSGVHLGPRLQ
jgi:hypothetical protein